MPPDQDRFSAIRKGLLEYLVLKIVSAEKVYAAEILAKLGGTEFATQEGTLYPLLSKLRRADLLDYQWVESEAGPPRKYYVLTARGRAWLGELNAYWKSLRATVERMGE